jgi:hypothetical protein
MKGSVALLGVTRHMAPWASGDRSALRHDQEAKSKGAAERRRPKGSSRDEL